MSWLKSTSFISLTCHNWRPLANFPASSSLRCLKISSQTANGPTHSAKMCAWNRLKDQDHQDQDRLRPRSAETKTKTKTSQDQDQMKTSQDQNQNQSRPRPIKTKISQDQDRSSGFFTYWNLEASSPLLAELLLSLKYFNYRDYLFIDYIKYNNN